MEGEDRNLIQFVLTRGIKQALKPDCGFNKCTTMDTACMCIYFSRFAMECTGNPLPKFAPVIHLGLPPPYPPLASLTTNHEHSFSPAINNTSL